MKKNGKVKKAINIFITTIGEILDEAWLGFTMETPKFPKKKKKIEDAYEKQRITYYFRGICLNPLEEDQQANNTLDKDSEKKQKNKVLSK